MSTFKIMLQEYKGNRFLKTSTVIFFLLVFLYRIPFLIEYWLKDFKDLVMLIGHFSLTNVIAFFFFLFISYYFFNLKNKYYLAECVDACNKKGVFLYQTLILTLFAFIYSLIFLISDFIIIIHSKEFHLEYILYVLELYFINGFLIIFLAVLIGAALALIKGRKSLPVFLILLTAVLTTPAKENLTNSVTFIEPITLFFDIFLPIDIAVDYGFANVSYRIQLVLAWVLLLAFINMIARFNMRKVQNRTVSALLAITCLSSFIMFSLPASRHTAYGNNYNDYIKDGIYYNDNKDKLRTEKADFNVTDYDISFKIKRNLSAEATLTVDKRELSEYTFTLHHGYKVKNITDENGKELKFNQDFDYIIVYSDGILNKIKMFYSGSGGAYFSNSQETNLPGWFPFYPQSGYKEIYYPHRVCYLPCTLSEKANFHIKIDAPKRVFTNLDEIAPNEFSGYAESLTMVAGFYEQVNINGISVVYPYLTPKSFLKSFKGKNFDEMEKHIAANIADGIFPAELKKVIAVPDISASLFFAGNSKIYSDYFAGYAIDNDYLKNAIFTMRVGAKRIAVYDMLTSYKNDRNYYDKGFIAWAKHTFGDEYPETEYGLFDECMKKYGLEFMEEKCPEFWESETEERDARQFLRDLLENGA